MSDVAWLQKWTELVSTADTVAELGKKLVHSKLTTDQAVGVYLFLLDSKGQIELLGGYGINPLSTEGGVSAWDDHVLAKSIQERDLVQMQVDWEGSKIYCYALPILKGEEPLGTALFCSRDKVDKFPKEVNASMSQMLGLWLQSAGLTNGFHTNGKATDANPESLTERQLKILEGMSLGKTNSEIAQEMILSESSIRQETVKIYRALGVGSRAEASKRAVHLGILRAPAVS
jgi:DNA-binding CsgD family transcriptional regulator